MEEPQQQQQPRSSEPPPEPDPDLEPPSLSATNAASLLTTFSHFLTVALHSLVFHRGLYPARTFLTARAYNLPVHQSRHPGLCAWITDAVAAVTAQLRTGAVQRVVVVIHAKSLDVLERWVFDLAEFPVWGEPPGEEDELEAGEVMLLDEEEEEEEEEEDEMEENAVNWTDVNEALRGALRRLAHAAEGLPALPEGSSFTLAVELRDDAPAPIGHPQPWVPSQPKLQRPTAKSRKQGLSLRGKTTMPIRSVRAGPLFFECWVEQGERPRLPPPPPQPKSKLKPEPKPKPKSILKSRSKIATKTVTAPRTALRKSTSRSQRSSNKPSS